MFCRHITWVWVWVCVIGVVFTCSVGRAGVTAGPPLKIASQAVHLDLPDGQAAFSLTFDHAPDFDHPDALGRRHDSFQYEIAPSLSDIQNADLFAITAVVRGDELSATQLPIRAGVADGIDPSAAAGGWGPLIGSVPYHLDGSTITFAAPLGLLGSSNGAFGYRVFTTNYGSTVSLQMGSAVSLPRAVWGGMAMLLALILWIKRHETAARHATRRLDTRDKKSSLVSPHLVSRVFALSRMSTLRSSVHRSVAGLFHWHHSPNAAGR
jgi:hypothetical protein